jgi:gliding motility-associated protein GldM
MAGKNLSPRQQMIGLMYLVLLAMLAMNASKDLLNAFVTLEKGIQKSSSNVHDKNDETFHSISAAALLGSEKATQVLRKSESIRNESKTLFEHIETLKSELIEAGGGLDENGIPIGKDNQDIGAEFLIFKGKGKELKDKIEAFKNHLTDELGAGDSAIRKSIEALLATPPYIDYEGNKTSWESGLSEHLPLAAVSANLTNIQTYIRNAEGQVLDHLKASIDIDDYKVNKIVATTLAPKGYVLEGESYGAEVFLAASDTTQEPIVVVGNYDTLAWKNNGKVKFIGKSDTLEVVGGKAIYNKEQVELGYHEWGGFMFVPHPNPKRKGEFLTYPFESNYTVGAPTAVISAEELQIMYIGLKNKISIAAPGVDLSTISVTAPHSKISKSADGKFSIEPTRSGELPIQVYYEIDGQKKLLTTQKWKSTRLPKPEVTILNRNFNTRENKNIFKVPGQQNIAVRLPPSFPLNANPKILNFSYSFRIDGSWQLPKSNTTGQFDGEFQRILNATRSGDQLEMEIRVRNPDGITHDLKTIITFR